jgi:hypothetical protein
VYLVCQGSLLQRWATFEREQMNMSRETMMCAVAVASMLWLAEASAAGQSQKVPAYTGRRTSGGKPDLNGIWQVLNSAAWDIQDHSGQLGVPPGQGVVEANEIPYQPWAAAKKKENLLNQKTADQTVANCFQPGVPRVTYLPFPFEIVQTPGFIAINYEFAHASRLINLERTSHDEELPDSWMGDPIAHWEGDTLVVDVKGFNDRTWFDQAGNFHSDALHVIERYTLTDPDHLLYEVTIEDPKVFTRPWKMSMPLYRRLDKNMKLLEYECVYYLQEERFKAAPFRR